MASEEVIKTEENTSIPNYTDETSGKHLRPRINPDNIRIYTKDKTDPNYNPDEFLLEQEQKLTKQRDAGVITQDEFEEQLTNYTPGQKIIMREDQRKYKELTKLSEKDPTLSKNQLLLNSFNFEDFKFNNLLEVSCFRQSMLLGLSTGIGLGAVIFITSKTVKKTTNWSLIGFFSGSIFGWEKCRYQRAQQMDIEKKLKEFQHQQKLKSLENEKRLIDKSKNVEIEHKKKWYKLW
ncbi:hypothetical protein QEN19_002076 [Hanseniaspora menglaensis]